MIDVKKVAELLTEMYGDSCACNFNGNDEWLPRFCKYTNDECPKPGYSKCWEEYLNNMDKKYL